MGEECVSGWKIRAWVIDRQITWQELFGCEIFEV